MQGTRRFITLHNDLFDSKTESARGKDRQMQRCNRERNNTTLTVYIISTVIQCLSILSKKFRKLKTMGVVHHKLEVADQKETSATSILVMDQHPDDDPTMGRSTLQKLMVGRLNSHSCSTATVGAMLAATCYSSRGHSQHRWCWCWKEPLTIGKGPA